MKKTISMLLALAMLLSVGMTAWAAEEDEQIIKGEFGIAPSPEGTMDILIAPSPDGGDEPIVIAPAPAPEGPFQVTFKGFEEDLVIETEGAVEKPKEEPVKEGCRFVGWSTYDDLAYVANFSSLEVSSDTVFYPVFVKSEEELKDFTVTLKDSEGKPLADTWVVIKGTQGTLANTNSDENGVAVFENLPEGLYNIQIMTEDRIFVGTFHTATDDGRVYQMSQENVSILTMAMGKYMMNAVVDGYEALADDEKEEEEPLMLACSLMQTWPYEDDATDAQKAIIEAAGEQTLMHFDAEIEKVYADSSDDAVPMEQTKHLLTLVIPFDPSTCTDVTVYRACDKKAEIFVADEVKPAEPQDGHCFVDTANGLLYIYTDKLTSYAVGCIGTLGEEEEGFGEDIFEGLGVSVSYSEHGEVEIGGDIVEGGTATVTVSPEIGFTLETIEAVDANGNKVELTPDETEKVFSFVMPDCDVSVEVSFTKDDAIQNAFVDVNADDYYYSPVLWAAVNEVTSGVDDAHFDPDGETTRAQMVTFLWRAAGSPVVNYAMDFTDVDPDAYYAEAVRWAVSEGITTGVEDKMFAPDQTVTRAEVVTFLWRMADAPMIANMTEEGPAPSPYADVATDAYYYSAVLWAGIMDITTGTGDETFSPNDTCTRAQVVTFLYRYFK